MKAIIAAIMLCACSATQEPFPVGTESEKQWKQEYQAGNITWSEYQALVKTGKKK